MKPGIWLLLMLALSGCVDEGAKTCDRVRVGYQQLLAEGVPPQAAQFSALLEQLAAIPKASKGRACADELVAAIRVARTARVLAPLAKRSDAANPADPCESIVQQFGRADAGERPALQASLVECRHLHLDEHHADEKASDPSP